jgi:hypothetical protein
MYASAKGIQTGIIPDNPIRIRPRYNKTILGPARVPIPDLHIPRTSGL